MWTQQSPPKSVTTVLLNFNHKFKVPIFKDAPTGFIEIVAQCIKPMYILKGEYIVKKGDMAREVGDCNII